MESRLGKYLTLTKFCTCAQTYQRFADQIDPFPKSLDETLPALEALCQYIINPVINGFGRDSPSERLRQRFLLTYGFCLVDLKRWLAQKEPVTRKKYRIATPSLDQHTAHEVNWNGRYYCDSRRDRFANRLGAACDFRILDMSSDALVSWIVAQGLPFDSLYFYSPNRPIHISYGPQHKRDIWAFTKQGTPTRYRPDWS